MGCCCCGPHLVAVGCSWGYGEAAVPGDDKVRFLQGRKGAKGELSHPTNLDHTAGPRAVADMVVPVNEWLEAMLDAVQAG